MALSVKNKIRLGTMFLFLLLLVTSGVGIYYIAKLKGDAEAILRDNYESLIYSHQMQQQLDELHFNFDSSIVKFEKALNQERGDITEPGEKEAVDSLEIYFAKIKSGDTTQENTRALESQIMRILALNVKAIELKNDKANSTAEKALMYITALAAIVFLISFTFVVNFPSVLTNLLLSSISHLYLPIL